MKDHAHKIEICVCTAYVPLSVCLVCLSVCMLRLGELLDGFT